MVFGVSRRKSLPPCFFRYKAKARLRLVGDSDFCFLFSIAILWVTSTYVGTYVPKPSSF